jgi:DNA-binding NtrC family response regulator
LVEPIAVMPTPAARDARGSQVEGNEASGDFRGHRSRASEVPHDDFRRVVDRVARTRITVLLTGETGSGKEVLARRLHANSPRAGKPFVDINCAAVCETLIESELFGFQRGAFTGAEQSKVGLIEAADGGTLFLDEVGELSRAAQAKLLRVIETRTVLPVGGTKPRPVDVRFIAATNVDLEAGVAGGRFREDLFFRLEGFRLKIPPLRARVDEILPAARQFLAKFSTREGMPLPVLTPGAKAALEHHRWPGNFRELRNVIERAAVLCTNGRIEFEDLQLPASENGRGEFTRRPGSAVPGAERARILDALNACAGNQTRAAQLLGISRRTLVTRLDSLGIARPQRGPLRAVAGERTCG